MTTPTPEDEMSDTSNVHHLAAPNNTVGMCTAAEAKFVVVFKDGTWRYEPNALEAEISSGADDFLVCVPLT